MAFVIAGCGSNQSEPNASESSTNTITPPAGNEITTGDENGLVDVKKDEDQAIEVDKGLLNVELTLPASFFEGQDLDQVIAEAKNEDGVSEVAINEDGSLTYKMTKAVHPKMMEKMKASAGEYIDSLKSGQSFASIKDVDHNESLTEFTLIVEKSAFEGSFDGFAAFGLGLQGMFYQAFDGVDQDKIRATINVKDEATGEVFDTIVYPDDMNQE